MVLPLPRLEYVLKQVYTFKRDEDPGGCLSYDCGFENRLFV